ncbi:MAG: hypothetical protein AB7J28_11085 [Hyphomonadaceae bacterium]
MRKFGAVLAAAALFLAGCGQSGQPAAKGEAPAQQQGNVALGSTQNMPDWLMVARTRDGGFVFFNQRTIMRNADGTADIWVQIQHGREQIFGTQGETIEQTIRFNLERLHYRFQCGGDRFLILRRQFMSGPDTVAAEEPMRTDIWRVVAASGPANVVRPIACRGR